VSSGQRWRVPVERGDPGYNWGTIRNNMGNASELSPHGYDYRNCTDYAAWKLASLGVQPAQYQGLGNANTWGTRAAAHGVVNNTTPAVGSVAVSTAGSFGHVAVVVAVTGGQITVSQYNQQQDGNYNTQTGTPASLGFRSFDHFEAYESVSATGGGLSPTPDPAVVATQSGVLRALEAPAPRRALPPLAERATAYEWSLRL
jgi:surface antigen